MAKRWPLAALGEVAPIQRRPVETSPDGSYPRLAVRSFGRGTFRKPPLDGEEITWQNLFQVRAGDLLFSNIKAWEGAVAVVANDDDGLFCSHRYITCVANTNQVLPSFLGYYFRTPQAVRKLSVASPGSADRNRTLSLAALKRMAVPVPDLSEQRRIVARLDQVERLSKDRLAAIEVMDAEVEAMLRSAFDRIIDGAPMRSMAEVAPLVRRAVEIDPDSLYTEIGVKSFYKGIFHRRSVCGAEFSWQKLFWIEKGDIVFSNLMAWEKAIAEAFDGDHGCVGNHRMLTCAPVTDVMVSGFLSFFFRTQTGFAEIVKASPGTAARNKTLSPALLAAIPVPTPPLEQQLWFDRVQSKVRDMRAIREQAACDAAALLPAMLHEIFGNVEAA